jgi:hypothetical protein
MAHFAKISEDNIVLSVLTLDDKDMLNENGNPNELVGQKYLEKHNNWPAHLWVQTSYNTYQNTHKLNETAFRGNYAGIGYIWDVSNQIFLPPKPYNSWVKNLQEARWESPIGDAPERTSEEFEINSRYEWNENNQSWYLVPASSI